MTHSSISHKGPAPDGIFTPHFITNRISNALARIKQMRDANTAIRQLSEHTDAELADIGILRSDLAEGRFEEAADARALAMLRVYR